MCSKYKDYLRHPATFAFFNGITLPEDSFSDHFPCKTNYRGFFSPIKKSQPAIHSYQLLIAGLDHKNKHYECIKNLVSTKTSCDTFSARQSKRKHSAISPPPRLCKGFSDCREFLQFTKIFFCQRNQQYIRSSGGASCIVRPH